MAVSIRGTVYQNAKTAADALGVSPATVYHAIADGREDTIGFGKGYKRGPESVKGGRPKKPVTLGRLQFPSIKEAARELKCSSRLIRWSLNGTATPQMRANMQRRVLDYIAAKDRERHNSIAEAERYQLNGPDKRRKQT